MKVLYIGAPGADHPWLEAFRDALQAEMALQLYDHSALPEPQLEGVDAVVELSGAPLSAATIEAAAKAGIKLWQVLGTGLDHMELARFRDLGIVVANTPGSTSATALAEHALALLLALVKNLAAHGMAMPRSSSPDLVSDELEGKRLGVVGFGASGRELARRARAFEMQVAAVDPAPPPTEILQQIDVVYLGGADRLDDLLRSSDVVSLHLPLVPSTRGLLDYRRLSLLRSGAILLNVARGALVDEQALVELLRMRRIRGAGLDVSETEPLSSDHPLLALDNVVLTPHVAGFTWQTAGRRANMAVENLRRCMRGDPPLSRVVFSEYGLAP